ncbi:4511_t:CDS:2, partial [Diversispora eburnea]
KLSRDLTDLKSNRTDNLESSNRLIDKNQNGDTIIITDSNKIKEK